MPGLEPHSEIHASLVVTFVSGDHEEVSRLLGLEPDKRWRIGDAIGNSDRVRTDNGWVVRSSSSKEDDVDAHARNLLNRLNIQTGLIWPSQYKVTLSLAVYIYNVDRPPIFIDRDIIRAINKIDAAVDVDLYVL